MMGGTQRYQSSIALQEDFFLQHSCSYSQKKCEPVNIQVTEVRKQDFDDNVYSPSRYSTITSATATNTKLNTANANCGGLQAEEQINTLRSKSLKELKLACSRRSIRYGIFSEKEEYVQAIWQDMEKTSAFSVTGLVQPGAAVELTEEQLDQELSGKDSLILVDVYATWCGPCRVLLPQLEVAAKKLVKDEVRVVKIDSDKYPSWAARYQVEGLPAILLIQKGKVLDRMEGAHTTKEIFDFVQEHVE
jgi:thioredoxin